VRHGQVAVVGVEAEAAGAPLRQRRHGALLAGARVEQVDAPHAVLVGDGGDQLAVVGHVDLLDVPGDVRRQVRVLAGGEVEPRQPEELAPVTASNDHRYVSLTEIDSRTSRLRPSGDQSSTSQPPPLTSASRRSVLGSAGSTT